MTGTPQQRGREFERTWAERVGGKPTPGSGAFFFSKLDVRDQSIRWSLKYTDHNSFSLSQNELREALIATRGPGGDNAVPAMALRIGGDDFTVVVMMADDWLALMETDETRYISRGKAEQRMRAARTPLLFREES